MIVTESAVALAGLFLAIGGQYAMLYQINQKIGALQMEFARCPWHGKSQEVG